MTNTNDNNDAITLAVTGLNDVITGGSTALSTDKVTYSINSLTLSEGITDDEIVALYKQLMVREVSRLWHWGDFLNEIKRLRPYKTSAPNTPEADKYARLVQDIIKASGYSSESLRKACRVCAFWAVPTRRSELLFEHHIALMEECGELEAALEWQARAIEGNWSSIALRSKIREAKGERLAADDATGHPRVKGSGSIYAAIRTATRIDPATLSYDDRVTLYDDMAPLVDWRNSLAVTGSTPE